jgi:hypothetical protein
MICSRCVTVCAGVSVARTACASASSFGGLGLESGNSSVGFVLEFGFGTVGAVSQRKRRRSAALDMVR